MRYITQLISEIVFQLSINASIDSGCDSLITALKYTFTSDFPTCEKKCVMYWRYTLMNKEVCKKHNYETSIVNVICELLSVVCDDTETPGCLCLRCVYWSATLECQVKFTDLAPNVFRCFIFNEIFLKLQNVGSKFLSLFREEVFLLFVFQDSNNKRHHRCQRSVLHCSFSNLQ